LGFVDLVNEHLQFPDDGTMKWGFQSEYTKIFLDLPLKVDIFHGEILFMKLDYIDWPVNMDWHGIRCKAQALGVRPMIPPLTCDFL
jgi:hypothetical protein